MMHPCLAHPQCHLFKAALLTSISASISCSIAATFIVTGTATSVGSS